MKLLIQAGFLAISLIIGMATTTAVFADDGAGNSANRMNILMLDMDVTTEDSGKNTVESFMGLLSTFGASDHYYLSAMDKPEVFYGPYKAGDINFSNIGVALDTLANTHQDGLAVDMPAALSEAYNFFALGAAPVGSTLYLVGQGEIESDSTYAAKYLDPLSDLFSENDWKITGVITENSSVSMVNVLDRVSSNTGSESYLLNATGGLKEITDYLMSKNSLGSLMESGNGNLAVSDVLKTKVNVAPGTKDLTLVFFKNDSSGSLRLNNPNGIEASAGDRTSSRVLETPYAVIWELEDPSPGTWSVDAKGIDGSVSAWHFATNKYRLNLINDKIMPTGEPVTITAYVTDEGVMVSPGVDAVMKATVTGPTGNEVVYSLNDIGKEGDVTAGDGYYSTSIPMSDLSGLYEVVLNLGWSGLDNTLTESREFKTQPFPSLEVTTLNTSQLYAGQTAIVANVLVNVAGEPVAVAPDSITMGSSDEGADPGILELIPRELTQDGRAWMYDVAFTPKSDGITSLTMSLDINYAGRLHKYVADTLTLDAIKLPVVPPTPYENNVVTSVVPNPVIVDQNGGFQVPVELVGIPIAIVALLLALTLYQRSLTRPFGILSNETSNTLVDFTNLKRSRFRSIFTPSVVHGSETGISELDGITFRFNGDRVEMYSVSVSPTVRVDNQPIVGEVVLKDRTWIGTRGRLFNFVTGVNNDPSPESSFGDD